MMNRWSCASTIGGRSLAALTFAAAPSSLIAGPASAPIARALKRQTRTIMISLLGWLTPLSSERRRAGAKRYRCFFVEVIVRQGALHHDYRCPSEGRERHDQRQQFLHDAVHCRNALTYRHVVSCVLDLGVAASTVSRIIASSSSTRRDHRRLAPAGWMSPPRPAFLSGSARLRRKRRRHPVATGGLLAPVVDDAETGALREVLDEVGVYIGGVEVQLAGKRRRRQLAVVFLPIIEHELDRISCPIQAIASPRCRWSGRGSAL